MYSWSLITGDVADTVDGKLLRQALGAFPTGVCLVSTVAANGKREGMTINSFGSVSLFPPLVLWSIRDDARSAEVFLASPHFIVSVLADSQQDLAMHFSRPEADKFVQVEAQFDRGIGGCPRLLSAVATFECSVYSRYQEGDHTILVGRVDAFRSEPLAPLVFCGGQMGSIRDLADKLMPAARQQPQGVA